MFVVPNEFDEPFTRLMSTQPQLAAFFLDSGVYMLEDSADNPTACTDGQRWIRLNRRFMKECLDGTKGAKGADLFVLAHEILHVMCMHHNWLASYEEHGFLVTAALLRNIQEFNPDTKWKVGMTIPPIWQMMQWAMDFVINDILCEWGMRIKPYSICHDHAIAVWTDSEETAYCRLIGKFKVEPPDPSGGGGGGEDEGKGKSIPGMGNETGGGRLPGNGHGDMVKGYDGDLPPEAQAAKPDDMRRKMAIEKTLKEIASKMPGSAGLGMARLIDRLLPSNIKWRQLVTTEIKMASGRGQSTWNRLSTRGLAMRTALPGHIGKQSGTVGFQRDTSGSVDDLQLAQMASCTMEAMKQVCPKRMIVFDTDAQVQQVREPKTASDLNQMLREGFKGGGGTDMGAAFDYCREKNVILDTMITITDGYTPWRKDHAPAKHALWIITTPGITAPPECGTSIYMPLDRNC